MSRNTAATSDVLVCAEPLSMHKTIDRGCRGVGIPIGKLMSRTWLR